LKGNSEWLESRNCNRESLDEPLGKRQVHACTDAGHIAVRGQGRCCRVADVKRSYLSLPALGDHDRQRGRHSDTEYDRQKNDDRLPSHDLSIDSKKKLST